ncbi:AAA family ATPase [Stakelama pacifica]|uniref:Exopolysaccharide/PEP-CTERM locus tyrosine autokinase n=1 Tax=Stakelama pacifica TaxID=517720 RepID=A0A4R6FFF0_9SPHN|nr:AAA family ATPase [Stakelama pacifica]TDN79867.1 exopolysaccharide/PEP-CTERM locus tyrosine autokinase [Stakelama pacifica]GGO98055.1 hypothetical protein GCM10011329_28320 [Stakelama pacifica]
MKDYDPRLRGSSLIERAVARLSDDDIVPIGLDPRPTISGRVSDAGPRHGAVPIDRAALERQGMLVPGAPVNALAEEMRLVKRHLLNTATDLARRNSRHARSILVGSARPGEGKTFSAINLAISLAAERDLDILLVDADFAKPDILPRLGVEAASGLLDALANPSSVDVERLILPTDIPHLSLLPAGTQSDNDTELLASSRGRALIDRLTSADPRRIVIFDSPPALAASSGSALASQVGQILMIVRADSTSESDLRAAVQMFDACEHIQLLLNVVTLTHGVPRFGYYGEEARR